jgi:predicted PurR-regulated permease PerM
MAGLFSLVPYLGSIATLTLLTLVGLVTFDSLPPVIGLSGSFLLLEILEGQFIQPFLLGRRLELNPVVVVLSIWVFGALWGFAGVVLAVPLLLTLKASVAHIDALHALSPLIGSISVPPSMRNTRSAPLQHPTAWWRRVVFAHGARDTSELLN